MTRVVYQRLAHADLLDVWSYIADDDITAADTYLDRIFELCELLADNPLMGVARDDVADGVRSFPLDRYVVFYELCDEGITVLRIWHSARDPNSFSI